MPIATVRIRLPRPVRSVVVRTVRAAIDARSDAIRAATTDAERDEAMRAFWAVAVLLPLPVVASEEARQTLAKLCDDAGHAEVAAFLRAL